MKKIENVYLIGLGGIGCAYASKLYDMKPEGIKIIVDEERYERYSKKGFIINGKHYDFDYVLPEKLTESADLIIVSVKYHHLNKAIENIRNFVGKNTTILSLLNGISSEEIIGNVYGMDKMLYGMCVGIDAVREDNNVRFSSTGKVNFGEKVNSIYSEKVLAVKDLLDKAGISYVIPEDMMRALWWKFMANVGINQSSAVLLSPYRAFQTIKEAKELMESAMVEVINISKPAGINLNLQDIDEWYKVLNSLNPENKTSMLQDMEAHRKTEVEMFSGTVCELGKKYGIETPVNKTLFNIIRSVEQKW